MNLKKSDRSLSLSFSWQGAVSDIAFLLIIFFVLTATLGLNRIIMFETDGTQTKVNNDDIVTIELRPDGSITYNKKNVSAVELTLLLDKKINYFLNINNSVKYKNFIELIDIFDEKEIKNIQIGN